MRRDDTPSIGQTRRSVAAAAAVTAFLAPISLVGLTAATPAGATDVTQSGGSGTISAPSALPSIVAGTAMVAEGNVGQKQLVLPVTLSSPSALPVTAHWATAFVAGARDFQATPGTDYVAASGTVTFAPGETSTSVTVLVNGDTTVEPNEYFVVSLTDPTNAQIGGFLGLGLARIVDDDQQPIIVPGKVAVYEGASGTHTVVHVPVSLSGPSGDTVTAEWSTRMAIHGHPGQATPVVDYIATAGTVSFAPGQTSATVDITVNGDDVIEPNEYIVVAFTHPTKARIGGFWGLGAAVIVDDDQPVAT